MGKKLSREERERREKERERKEIEEFERDQRAMDRHNLNEYNTMAKWGNYIPDEDAWMMGIAWDEEKQEYVLLDSAFDDGLEEAQEESAEYETVLPKKTKRKIKRDKRHQHRIDLFNLKQLNKKAKEPDHQVCSWVDFFGIKWDELNKKYVLDDTQSENI